MQKRIGEVEEFAFDYLTDGSHLHITIAISGWLTKEGIAEFSLPWRTLYNSREQVRFGEEGRDGEERGMGGVWGRGGERDGDGREGGVRRSRVGGCFEGREEESRD